jgi:DNA-binding transcriptional regulator GbsR (MarR family)
MQNPATLQFIERMGLAIERLGQPRTFGRLFGLLLIADRPLSLGELAGHLQVSKASISTNARAAEEIGLIRQVGLRGDRRDYYEMVPHAFERMTRRRVQSSREMAGLAAEGLDALGDRSAVARERLTEMLGFYLFMGEGVENLLERWRELQG